MARDITPRLLNATEAADYLGGLSPRTLREWARRGRIPSVRVGGRRVRFDRETLDRLIDEDAVGTGAAT